MKDFTAVFVPGSLYPHLNENYDGRQFQGRQPELNPDIQFMAFPKKKLRQHLKERAPEVWCPQMQNPSMNDFTAVFVPGTLYPQLNEN